MTTKELTITLHYPFTLYRFGGRINEHNVCSCGREFMYVKPKGEGLLCICIKCKTYWFRNNT